MTLGEFMTINASVKLTVALSEAGKVVGYLDVDYGAGKNDNVLPLVHLRDYNPNVRAVSAMASSSVYVVVDISDCEAGIHDIGGIVWFDK